MPRIALSNYEAFYQQIGHGPDVVLIHGFTSNMAMWVFGGIADSLKDRFRVTSYDLRGHGASSTPTTGYTSDVLADDLAELHEALRLQPAYIVGHSLGGVVGMHAAVRHPARIAGNILSDTYFPGLSEIEPNMSQIEVWLSLRDIFLKVNHEIGLTVDFRRLLDIVATMGPDEQATLRESFGPPVVRWLSQLKPLAGSSAPEEVFQTAGLTADALRTIRQPVVALYDERTPFEATWNWLGENIRDFRGDRVPGAAHLALLENPEVFAQLVRKHLVLLCEQAATSSDHSAAGARG
ncbi:MAG TPA: alpha/beta hydrolase [Pirellulales bacterium]|jgi:pimeloyl-ACP methyl ester carboxylesterase